STGSILWLSLSVYGFWKHWKDNLFLSAWYALTIFPFLFSGLLTWYYLPVLPAMCYFASLTLAVWKGKEKTDPLLWFFLGFLILLVVAASGFVYLRFFGPYFEQREAGLMLSGKENVLVIGDYYPGVIAYKTVPEMREGKRIDFGWIAFPLN